MPPPSRSRVGSSPLSPRHPRRAEPGVLDDRGDRGGPRGAAPRRAAGPPARRDDRRGRAPRAPGHDRAPSANWPYATLPPDANPAPPPGGPAPGDEGADSTVTSLAATAIDGPDGPRAHPPVARDPVRGDGRRLLRPCQQHPRPGGPRSRRDDGGLHPPRGRAVRHGRGHEPDRPCACERADRGGRSPVRRRHRLGEGGRAPHPGALPGVRAVRDRHARDAGPVDRLGDGGPRVRRRRGPAAGDLVRGAARAPGHHRRPGLRGDRRRLRRARRRPLAPGWPASTRPGPCPTRWS